MKPGYKQTEVGVVPTDWTTRALGEIGDSLIGLTYRPDQVRDHGTLVLRSSNIQEGTLRFDDNVYVDADIPERIMVRPGDILICVRTGSRDLIDRRAKVLVDLTLQDVRLEQIVDELPRCASEHGHECAERHADSALVQ